MAVVSVLVGCALTRSGALQIKQVSINGAKLTYQEQGRGRPTVFVHGAITDYRTWEGQREAVAAYNRFIALTMRYFGTDPWPDEGANYSMKTHTDDLIAFIQNLNAATSVTRCIPGAKLVVMPKGRHAAPVQATSAFNEALLRFLTAN
jgi:pimeloyl-ACP methyl ester carboxylesterase